MTALKTALGLAGAGLIFLAGAAIAQEPAPAAAAPATLTPDGAALFKKTCGDCHDPAVGEAPDKATLATHKPDELFDIMKSGVMSAMASGLKDDEMKAIAAYLTKPAP